MADSSKAILGASMESGAFGASNTVRLEITNWSQVMKTLKELDSDYVRELRKDFREIAKEPQKKVRNAIPPKNRPPLRNMRQVHFGRLAWGTTFAGGGKKPKPAKSVLIQQPSDRRRAFKEAEKVPIVRLQVGSAATVLFDMAYRLNGTKGRRGYTPEYDYMYTINGQKVPGKRKHKVRPLAFARGLAKSAGRLKSSASRIIWPAAEDAMPEATRAINAKITEVNAKITTRLLGGS